MERKHMRCVAFAVMLAFFISASYEIIHNLHIYTVGTTK